MNAVVPAQEARPSLVAGGRPMAIVPTTMDEAYRLGKAIVASGMAPKGMETPEKCMIAIMRGMEVGLTPMQAVDKIAVVNGRPTIWGDGAMALVRGSGACEYVKEVIQGQGDAQVAICEAKRRGEAEPVVRTFSVADAKKANLWGKSGPWQQLPARMLQMRARAFALRDLFADVLGGLYLREEIEDESRQIRDVTPAPRAERAALSSPPPAARLSGPPTARRPTSPPPAQKQQAAPEPEITEERPVEPESDLEAMVRQFEEDAQSAQTIQDLEDCADELLPFVNGDRSHLMGRELRTRAENVWTDAEKRIANARNRPQTQPEHEEDEPAIDPEDPDYLKGRIDFAAGKTKCLKAEIRDNPERHAKWQRGFLDAKNDADSEGEA